MVLISAIMPIYNVEKYLERSIESIRKQTFKNWELILVNDGSEDKSPEICNSYAKKDFRIKVVHQLNQGSGAARQNGINVAQGEYLYFIDPDDYLTKNAFEENSTIINKLQPQVIVNGFNVISINSRKERKIKKVIPTILGEFNRQEFIDSYEIYVKYQGYRAVWNKLYQRDFIISNRIEFSALPIGQDAAFNFEVYKQADSILINDECYYFYDNTREDSAVNKYHPQKFESHIHLINKEKELLKTWEMLDDYKEIIYGNILNIIKIQISNLHKSSDHPSVKIKANALEKSLSNKNFDEYFQVEYLKKTISLKDKIILNLIKQRRYKFIFLLYKLKR